MLYYNLPGLVIVDIVVTLLIVFCNVLVISSVGVMLGDLISLLVSL